MPISVDTNYPPDVVAASHSGLIELARCLTAYRDTIVLVGGWVPYLLLRDHPPVSGEFKHVGSVDIDLAVDTERVPVSEYSTIQRLILDRGWELLRQDGALYRYHKSIRLEKSAKPQDIVVDFLISPDSAGGNHRHRDVQGDLKARVSDGIPVAMRHRTRVELTGRLPDDGGETHTSVAMADVVGCVGMKALVLSARHKEKDAYDLYAVLENYGNGPREVASVFRPYTDEALLSESLQVLREKFESPRAEGSRSVANFYTSERGEARERRAVRAYQTVRAFLDALG